MILFIDNYDSFTYNLVDYLGQLEPHIQVVRNDRITVQEIQSIQPEAIVLSPGPGRPEDAGICCDLIRQLGPEIPVLGVCLGHQCIGVVYGGRVVRAPYPVHGKTSEIRHRRHPLFAGIPSPFRAARYHSLVLERHSLPDSLQCIAEEAQGLVMAVVHRRYPVAGVQFHPESVATEHGQRFLRNWLSWVRSVRLPRPARPAANGLEKIH